MVKECDTSPTAIASMGSHGKGVAAVVFAICVCTTVRLFQTPDNSSLTSGVCVGTPCATAVGAADTRDTIERSRDDHSCENDNKKEWRRGAGSRVMRMDHPSPYCALDVEPSSTHMQQYANNSHKRASSLENMH